MVPTLATDNLYKFVALFGLVMALFAVTYPVRLMQEDKVKIVSAEKEGAILKVGMDRKREAVKRLEAEFKTKSGLLDNENALLAQKSNQLDEKSKALERQKKVVRADNPALVEALARVTDEQNAIATDVTARRARVEGLAADVKPVKAALDAANDEVAVSDIELGAQGRVLESVTRHYDVAKWFMALFGMGGVYMCIKGFGLWYYRIQRYQDAALRKYAEEEGLAGAKPAGKKVA